MKTSAIIETIALASEGSAPPERRKAPRFPCEGTCEVVVLGGALRFTGELRDLSAFGCRLATEVVFTLERGTYVEVLMVVNRVQFRVAAGVRATSRTRGVGLEFMNLSGRRARLIQELILELKAKTERERSH